MLRNKLSDRIFFRTMFTSFGMRPVDPSQQTTIPYFRYEIGPYRTDYLLHFRREPNWDLYKSEVFNKLEEVSGYDIARYQNFHYQQYTDKADFLRFLRYETNERIRWLGGRMRDWRIKLELVLAWVEEPLFRQFSMTDIASILHQFEHFKDMKVNTLQKRIIDCNNDLRPTDPKTALLIKALTDFFY